MNHRIELDDLLDLDLSMVKGILIDIDDTLYSYVDSHQKALSFCVTKFQEEFCSLNQSIDAKTFESLYRTARDNVTIRLKPNGACRSRLLAFQEIFESIGELTFHDAYQHALEFEESYWSVLINNMERNEKMFLFVEKCLLNNLKVCAVSDMQTSFQIRKLIKLGYKDISLVTSEEVGVEKPDEAIFYYALNKINLKPEQVIMIGDSYAKDILGATNIGIQAYQVFLND